MFLLESLKLHLNQECAIIYREFSEICGSNIQAAQMLGKFAYWSDVKHRTEPQSCGWFYKTAQDLLKELGFTRRAYEKGRKFLIENGLVQYRRGGVHGKMHFCVNFGRILELIYEMRGQKPPKDVLNTQIDIHNYQIPKWIPIDEWNAYLYVYQEKKGCFPSNKQKSRLIKQLSALRSKFDLKIVIERSILNAWIGFYSPDYQSRSHSQSSELTDYQKNKQTKIINEEIKTQQKQREELSNPRTDEEKRLAKNYIKEMLAILKSSKSSQSFNK